MKKYLGFLVVLVLTFALVGCGNARTFNNSEVLPTQTMLPEISIIQDIEYPIEYPIENSIIEQPTLINTWQEAFVNLLLADYEGRILGRYAEFMWEVGNHFSFSGLFTLHDMNGDGVPELIIWEAGQGGFFYAYSAYTYSNNNVVPLEINGNFGGRGYSIFSPPNNIQGIIAVTVESGFTGHRLIQMDGYSLSSPISIYEDWTGMQTSDGTSLYFVRGLEVASREVPYELKHIFDCCCVEERASRGIFYTLVVQEEFYRVLEDVFGNPSNIGGDWPSEITVTNIQNIILGWDN